jgi:hypothetical protein
LRQAEDDHVDNVNDSLAYYIALKKAAVPVEVDLCGDMAGGDRDDFGINALESYYKEVGGQFV